MDKLSRKKKKAYLGKRMSRSQLRRLLDSVVVIPKEYPESPDIEPYYFCPRCGCDKTESTGNMVEYPEVWVKYFCARCGFHVGGADNSPYYHALEFKEYDYVIE